MNRQKRAFNKMHNLLLFLLAVSMAVTLVSCSDDDDSEDMGGGQSVPITLENLAGEWVFTSGTSTECDDEGENSEDVCTSDCQILDFSLDGTVDIIDGDDVETRTVEIDENELITACLVDDPEDCVIVIATIIDDTLTLVMEDVEPFGCTDTSIYERMN